LSPVALPGLDYPASSNIIPFVDRIADRFVLARELGSGGMATVHLGRDEVLDRAVAVKVLKSGFDGEIAERFQREGRTAARLSHPNVVQVYDAGEAEFEGGNAPYIVMEHVSGGDLKQLIDAEGSLDSGRVASLGAGVAAGLAHAHDRGVIHRDIKPHNILLDEFGSPKLTDFGIARALDATAMTVSGFYLGTALYSAPEQLKGQEITTKSDVYSLGAALYQAAAGEPPFSGSSLEVANQHATREPESPGSKNPSGAPDPELDALILSCLAKEPDDRPSAAEARDRLSSVAYNATGPGGYASARRATPAVAGSPATRTRNARKNGDKAGTRRRKPLLRSFAGALALVLLLTAGAVFALIDGTGLQSPPSGGRGSSDGGGAQSPGGSPQGTPQAADVSRGSSSSTGAAQDTGQATDQATGEATAREASRTVSEMYELAAAGDYEASYGLLSSGFRQREAGSLANWAGTFDTLESISFIEGPTASVSGSTARVTGTTRAVHTDDTEFNRGTWTLVRENGRWRVEDLSIQRL